MDVEERTAERPGVRFQQPEASTSGSSDESRQNNNSNRWLSCLVASRCQPPSDNETSSSPREGTGHAVGSPPSGRARLRTDQPQTWRACFCMTGEFLIGVLDELPYRLGLKEIPKEQPYKRSHFTEESSLLTQFQIGDANNITTVEDAAYRSALGLLVLDHLVIEPAPSCMSDVCVSCHAYTTTTRIGSFLG